MTPVLIIGCGDVGCRVALHWRQRGAPVHGLVRTAERAERLHRVGVNPIPGDLDDPGAFPGLPPAEGAVVYYFAPPAPQGRNDARVAVVTEHFKGRPARLVYISTTGVYGDHRGGWVTEDTPVTPMTERGRRRWAAEQCLDQWGLRHGVPVARLRVPGIYGPGRLPLERIRQRLPVVTESESPYSNRIHVDDLARVCAAFGEGSAHSGVFNVSDGHPTTMTDYFNRVAEVFGLPRPPAISLADARRQMSPAMYSFWRESRRVDNQKLCRTLAIGLDYPTLEDGLKACATREAHRPPL